MKTYYFNDIIIISIFVAVSVFVLTTVLIDNIYSQELNNKEDTIKQLNEARIKAENKPCCQLIQERYIDKRLSEDGLMFIYEEHPRIEECTDIIGINS